MRMYAERQIRLSESGRLVRGRGALRYRTPPPKGEAYRGCVVGCCFVVYVFGGEGLRFRKL